MRLAKCHVFLLLLSIPHVHAVGLCLGVEDTSCCLCEAKEQASVQELNK